MRSFLKDGDEPYKRFEICLDRSGTTYQEISDAIFMIHDWHQSKRACDELQYAKSLGKKIIYQDYFGRKNKQNETRNCD